MIWLLYIVLDAVGNWYLIEKKKTRPVYIKLFLMRGLFAVAYGILILNVRDEYTAILWALFTTMSFPFLFNCVLNLLRGLPLIYFGKSSGWIDSFVIKHSLERIYFLFTMLLFWVAMFIWIRLAFPIV